MANEVRLIDANAFCAKYEQFGLSNGSTLGRHSGMVDWLLGELQNAPTIDPENLRPKGRWEIHCHSTYDSWTQETDEEFYLECSVCKRQVWDIDYMAVQNDDRQKLIEKYPYCHCGCKMEG